ncbi:hypothetical protein GCM10027443_32650 [Pontibacter brevis]
MKWSAEELAAANTGRDADYLNDVEKETLFYLNLARLYPQKFVKLEVVEYMGTHKYGAYLKRSPYKQSLIKEMNSMQAMEALMPDKVLTEAAKCFAKESGMLGKTGHHRDRCQKVNYAECCSYGMDNGKDVVLQLLIDHGVPSLGHRRICFNPGYSKAGLGFYLHTKWDECLVLDMI